MAETVIVPGGLFDIAIPHGERTTPDEAINHLNMALARGFLLTWDYGERIHRQTGEVEKDLVALAEMKTLLGEAVNWTAADFTTDAEISALLIEIWENDIPNEKVALALQATTLAYFDVNNNAQWPPSRTDSTGAPIGAWPNVGPVTNYPASVPFGAPDQLFVSSDGVIFRMAPGVGSSSVFEVIDRSNLDLQFPNTLVISDLDLNEMRRNLELKIESMTQLGQNKQAFLQDLVGNLQKWLTFVTSLLDKKKRDYEGIVANFK